MLWKEPSTSYYIRRTSLVLLQKQKRGFLDQEWRWISQSREMLDTFWNGCNNSVYLQAPHTTQADLVWVLISQQLHSPDDLTDERNEIPLCCWPLLISRVVRITDFGLNSRLGRLDATFILKWGDQGSGCWSVKAAKRMEFFYVTEWNFYRSTTSYIVNYISGMATKPKFLADWGFPIIA